METITNTMQKTERASVGTSAMVALSIGVALAFAMGFATPPKANALTLGTNPCPGCGSYSTSKPAYKSNYSYKKPSSGTSGGWSNFLNGLTINWHDNSDSNNTNISNTTNNNTNVNTNINGNDNYIGGVAVSTQTNTDISSWTSANYNQPNYTGGAGYSTGGGYYDYAYGRYRSPSYVGGVGGSNLYSSNDLDNDNGNQNNNFNVNFGSNKNNNDDDDDNDDDIDCELDASDTSVDEDDRITLSWDTEGDVDEARINQGIGSVDEDGGSLRFTVDDEDVTFRMTVENDDGDEATCSVTVDVDDDNDNNDLSSAVFTDEAPQNPSQVVYLSSIPYTGLDEVTPDVLAYWLLLIAGAGGMVWFAFSKGMIGSFAFASATGSPMRSEYVEETEEETESNVNAFISALATNDQEAAVEYLRTAAADGTGVEEFLEEARASVEETDPVAARLDAALAESRLTGIRGAKAALAA